MKKADLFWQSYLNLERSFLELSEYIFITDTMIKKNSDDSFVEQLYPHQLNTFSPYIADLLVQCCIQIEAISKELYYEIGGTKPRGDNTILFDEDCLKEIDKIWSTHNKIVLVTAFNFSKPENKILMPLREAHKRGEPYWKKAYQAVKHDRYNCLSMGNVRALLRALAALFLLNLYYKKDHWLTTCQDISKLDMSCGSKIFAVNPPKTDGAFLWGSENVHIAGDSPYIVRYTDEEHKKITVLQEQGKKKLDDFLNAQPETNDVEFAIYLSNLIEKIKVAGTPYSIAGELMKFRLNRRIPSTLSFEERKGLLLNSKEYKGRTYSSNQHLKSEEITPDNIQAEIDRVGYLAGIDIEIDIGYLNWLKVALIDTMCEVRIPTLLDVTTMDTLKDSAI